MSLTLDIYQTLNSLPFNNALAGRFTQQDRLLTEQEYSYVFDDPIRTADSCYTVLARRSQQSAPRLGVIVSKKNVARAVARNRLKRIVRESFRLHKNILPAFDVIVICKKNSARSINKKLFEQLQNHWKFLHNHAE